MIFADKLIQLRKKYGWSQEELADKMNVTRQSVSKWEGAQSIPELEKIIRLSELFGVSTDYLLKDEVEDLEFVDYIEETAPVRKVSMEEANEFLYIKEVTSKSIALGVFLCIVSPVSLLILFGMSESPNYSISENMATGAGMVILLAFIAVASIFFITSGNKTSPYIFLEKEVFETNYGVDGMVRERKNNYRETYLRNNIIGTLLVLLAAVPIFAGTLIFENDEFLSIVMVSLTLVLVALGSTFFIRGGIIWASFEKLLQEGDYSKKEKEKESSMSSISTIYWLVITAIYLGYSFYTRSWNRSWILLVVAGVLYPALMLVIDMINKKNKDL